jgi:hypothetical protein
MRDDTRLPLALRCLARLASDLDGRRGLAFRDLDRCVALRSRTSHLLFVRAHLRVGEQSEPRCSGGGNDGSGEHQAKVRRGTDATAALSGRLR